MTGIHDYVTIDDAGGIQWPFPEGTAVEPAAERRLFEDGRFHHPDGRARFCFEPPRPVPHAPSDEFPLILLTGRGSSSQWHTGTRTAKSAVLRAMQPDAPYVDISPTDARARALDDGDRVIVTSASGSMQASARVTPIVAPGQVFVAMHDAQTNRLTLPAFDPYSRQPSYKRGAVEVRRAGRRRR